PHLRTFQQKFSDGQGFWGSGLGYPARDAGSSTLADRRSYEGTGDRSLGRGRSCVTQDINHRRPSWNRPSACARLDSSNRRSPTWTLRDPNANALSSRIPEWLRSGRGVIVSAAVESSHRGSGPCGIGVWRENQCERKSWASSSRWSGQGYSRTRASRRPIWPATGSWNSSSTARRITRGCRCRRREIDSPSTDGGGNWKGDSAM